MKKWIKLLVVLFSLNAASAQPGLDAEDSIGLDEMIGQMVMVGIDDLKSLEGTESLLYAISQGHVGGVVLYEKNISKTAPFTTLKTLITGLQINTKIPLFISIDEEGGKVSRLKSKYGFPKTVTHAYLGKMDQADTTYFYSAQTADLLDSVGINLNYAPDIDVNLNPDNPVIGSLGRSFSKDHKKVVFHANHFIRGHRDHNVGTVLKHFPGHGSSHNDSHFEIADVTKHWNFDEMRPYKTLIDSGMVNGIMTAHIINGHLDNRKIPATLSEKIIKGLLREYLGYEGVVFSDDMQMHAISKHFGFEQSVVNAINAGVDVIMFANNVTGNDYKDPEQIFEMIKRNVIDGNISAERIRASYDRILKLKKNLSLMR